MSIPIDTSTQGDVGHGQGLGHVDDHSQNQDTVADDSQKPKTPKTGASDSEKREFKVALDSIDETSTYTQGHVGHTHGHRLGYVDDHSPYQETVADDSHKPKTGADDSTKKRANDTKKRQTDDYDYDSTKQKKQKTHYGNEREGVTYEWRPPQNDSPGMYYRKYQRSYVDYSNVDKGVEGAEAFLWRLHKAIWEPSKGSWEGRGTDILPNEA